MSTDPFHIIEPYQPTFVSDQTLEPRPIEEAIEGATGAVLGDGLSFFGMSATVPAGFRMYGRSIPGLTLEVHRRGRSVTTGSSHDRVAELSTGIATFIYTDQPEGWETRASAGERVELFTVLTDLAWLERADIIPSRRDPLTHLAIGYSPVDLRLLELLPVADSAQLYSPNGRLLLEGIVLQLLGQALERFASDKPPIANTATIRRANRARDYLLGAPVDKVSIVSAARALNTSPRQLQRDFLAVFGAGPISYVRRHRLALAASSIRYGELTILEAALQAGYADAGSFSRALTKALGLRPRDLMRNRQRR